ncbi:MAG TPA: Rid family detoxifying hydrolase [Candidatus Limnocylindria bacterium]|nr:Rid family detoxifying hydrolase [Candidatus Limnocylindria bacterium]
MNKVISTTGAPTALGPYSQGIDTGSLVFVAGQIGREAQSGDLADGVEAQTREVMRNIAAILEAAGLSWADVVKTTCFLADIADFEAFNSVYKTFVGDAPPARSTFAVKDLPRGARVEVEAIAARG